MTDQKWIALLSFLVTVLTLLSGFGPLAAYGDWFKLAGAIIAAFVGAWFGVPNVAQALRVRAAKK